MGNTKRENKHRQSAEKLKEINKIDQNERQGSQPRASPDKSERRGSRDGNEWVRAVWRGGGKKLKRTGIFFETKECTAEKKKRRECRIDGLEGSD